MKLEICRQLLGVMTHLEIADEVFERDQDKELALKVADSLRKWHKCLPRKQDGPGQFFDALANTLGCNQDVTGARLIHANIEQFISYLPAQKQQYARDILCQTRSKKPEDAPIRIGGASVGLAAANLIRLQNTKPIETVAQGYAAGRIDQRHYYHDADTSDSWGRLIRAESYTVYDHCKSALRDMLSSEQWKQAVDASKPKTVVMLAGGGSPTKDVLLLRHFLGLPHITDRLHYCLVDISLHMLRDSALSLNEHMKTIDGAEYVTIDPIHDNILEMKEDHRQWFHQHGSAVFGITGVSIGNISESSFFISLDAASTDGDLLFVSAETIGNEPSEEVRKAITRKYNSPELYRLIRPIIRSILSIASSKESVDQALERIKVQLAPAGAKNASDIPNSWSVVVSLEVAGREIVLVTSTRYVSDQLIRHASLYGWKPIAQVPSPQNPDYKQFLFKRNKAELSGAPFSSENGR